MICQVCGSRPAMVHYEEIGLNGRRHLWLCEDCAESRRVERFRAGEQPLQPSGRPEEPQGPAPDPRSGPVFESFLEQRFETGLQPVPDGDPGACPACGFELTDLGATNRLGCATCYDYFRERLRPLLVRIHHHSSHLGKVPRRAWQQRSLAGEIARNRVALEKAIAAEQYEEAARLRDLISRLEARERRDSDEPEGSGGEP